MRTTNALPKLTGEHFLREVQQVRQESEGQRLLFSLVPEQYVGKILVVRTLDNTPTIDRLVYRTRTATDNLAGYYFDSHLPRVREARGRILSPVLYGACLHLRDMERHWLRRNAVEYHVPLLDEQTNEPLVRVEVFEKAK